MVASGCGNWVRGVNIGNLCNIFTILANLDSCKSKTVLKYNKMFILKVKFEGEQKTCETVVNGDGIRKCSVVECRLNSSGIQSRERLVRAEMEGFMERWMGKR